MRSRSRRLSAGAGGLAVAALVVWAATTNLLGASASDVSTQPQIASGNPIEPEPVEDKLARLVPAEGWQLAQQGDAILAGIGSSATGGSGEDVDAMPRVNIEDLDEWRQQKIAEFYETYEPTPVRNVQYKVFSYGPAGEVPTDSGVLIHLGKIEDVGREPPAGPGDVVLTTEAEVIRIRTWGPDAPSASAVADLLQG